MEVKTAVITIPLGVLLGIFTAIDIALTDKRRNKKLLKEPFTRQVILVIALLFAPIISTTVPGLKLVEYSLFFYPSYVSSVLISFLVIYVKNFRPLIRKNKRFIEPENTLTFLDFLEQGHKGFKREIQKNKEKNDLKENEMQNLLREYKKKIPQFIHDIIYYKEEDEDENDLEGFIGWVLFRFLHKFFSEQTARFTLRQLNYAETHMDTLFTTGDLPPQPIPLDKKNLINKSMEAQEPLLYSRNRKFHFSTGKSITKRVYDNYVSYCLIKENNKPKYSINLDVKGEKENKLLAAFVDSSIFTVMCNIIKDKIEYHDQTNFEFEKEENE